MNRFIRRACPLTVVFVLLSASAAFAQTAVSPAVMVKIVRAEDERQFNKDIENFLKSLDAATRKRAALAAGRIADEKSVLVLIELLEKDKDADVRTTAAFALGEIESATATDAILRVLANAKESAPVRARTVEAAGKIAAANPKDAKTVELGEAILDVLEAEREKPDRDREIVLLALTAVLRVKPPEADFVAAKFLTDKDARVRADAANTLARLKPKNENTNAQLRAMLLSDDDANVRANAARLLGASEDKLAFDLLVEAASTDEDSRVRIAAIRSLASSRKNKNAYAPLLARAKKLLADYKIAKAKFPNPSEKNELLEIIVALGEFLHDSENRMVLRDVTNDTFTFLSEFQSLDGSASAETEIAIAKITPEHYAETAAFNPKIKIMVESADSFFWQSVSAVAQGLGELSKSENLKARKNAEEFLSLFLKRMENKYIIQRHAKEAALATPDILRAYISFKPQDSQQILLNHLKHKDVTVRATAAELLGEQPTSKEITDALQKAFFESLKTDLESNDATLAILSALVKSNKNAAALTLLSALAATDFLVRRHAAELVKTGDIDPAYRMVHDAAKNYPGLYVLVGTNIPSPIDGKAPPEAHQTADRKLGVLLNKPRDYTRAIARKNGRTRAVLTTEKGTFTIDLLPEDAPLTVDNFVKLAKSNYFNGLTVHRVVPNFVMQDGDPRGDGNGGPGWQIRDEINFVPYERGAVGMALSGKDTGGSQWFVTHSPQPHLDGGYTVFGRVGETDMKVVDQITRGDKILTVKIIEGNSASKTAKTRRKTK